MPNVPWNTLSELRHTLSGATKIMHEILKMCDTVDCVHKDSSLRQTKALYYHLLNIIDDLNIILDEVKDEKG